MKSSNQYGATVVIGFAFATFIPSIISVLPLLTQDFSHVENIDLMSKLMITLPGLIAALTAPIVGILINRFGKKQVFFTSVLSLVIFGFMPYLLNSMAVILLTRCVLGIVQAGLLISTTVLIASGYEGQDRHKMMGIHAGAFGFGPVVGLLAMGFLGDYGWRYAFFIFLMPLLLLPFILKYIQLPIIDSNVPVSKEHEVANGTLIQQYPQLRYLFLMAFISTILIFLVVLHVPFRINQLPNIQPSDIAIAIATWTIFKGLSAIFFKTVKAMMRYNHIFVVAFLILALGFIGIGYSINYLQILLALIVCGVGTGLLLPNINTWIAELVPDIDRSRAYGWMITCMGLGQFFCTILTQPIVASFGIQLTFLMMGAGVILMGLLLLFYPDTQPN